MNQRKHPQTRRFTVGELLQRDMVQRERRTFGEQLGKLIGSGILMAILWL